MSLPTAKGSRTEVAPRIFKPPKSIQLKRLSPSLCFPMDQKSVHEGAFGVGQKDGVIIVDHGSRRKESNILLSNASMFFFSLYMYPLKGGGVLLQLFLYSSYYISVLTHILQMNLC